MLGWFPKQFENNRHKYAWSMPIIIQNTNSQNIQSRGAICYHTWVLHLKHALTAVLVVGIVASIYTLLCQTCLYRSLECALLKYTSVRRVVLFRHTCAMAEQIYILKIYVHGVPSLLRCVVLKHFMAKYLFIIPLFSGVTCWSVTRGWRFAERRVLVEGPLTSVPTNTVSQWTSWKMAVDIQNTKMGSFLKFWTWNFVHA